MQDTIDSAFRFPPNNPGESTTADTTPNPWMSHSPAFSSPVSGHHTSPVSGDPIEALWDSASEFGDRDVREERQVSVQQKCRTCVSSFARANVQRPEAEEAER